MIAKIAPLTRLPKHLHVFDYGVPVELKDVLCLGQFVKIPLRKGIVFGVVISLHRDEEVSEKLKFVDSVVHDVPVFSLSQLKMYVMLAELYGVALGALLKMAMLPLQKRKLKTVEFKKSKKDESTKFKKLTYFRYNSNSNHQKVIQDLVNGYTLVVVPERYLIEEVVDLFSDEQKKDLAIWHSELSVKEQYATWLRIRNGEVKIIVGTRGVVLLPFFQLDTVVIDYEERENHKHWDQTPRFYVKDVVSFFTEVYRCSINYASYSPSLSSYWGVHKDKIDSDDFSIEPLSELPNIVNMKNERRGGNYEIFSDKLKDAVMSSTNDVFLFLQRKGDATYVGCEDCGFVANCDNCLLPLITYQKQQELRCHYCGIRKSQIISCPTCNSMKIKVSGLGTDSVVKYLKELGFEKNEIIKIDGNVKIVVLPDSGRRIIVGTQKAFSYVRWGKTDVVGFISLDQQLAIPEYTAGESVWHRIQEVQYRRGNKSEFFIQTFEPRHLVTRSLNEPDRFYRTDLHARRGVRYPPYVYIARYFYGHEDYRTAKITADRVHFNLKKTLTTEQKNIILSGSIEMHPRYFRRKFWFVFTAKFVSDSWKKDVLWLNRHIPTGWRVDPHPHSILSP